MGIKNGWELAAGYSEARNVTDFSGASIAIDLPIIIKQLESSGGSLIRGVFRRTLHLMAHGIRPVMVFEGSSVSEEKRRVQLERQIAGPASSKVTREARLALKRAAQDFVCSQDTSSSSTETRRNSDSDSDIEVLDSSNDARAAQPAFDDPWHLDDWSDSGDSDVQIAQEHCAPLEQRSCSAKPTTSEFVNDEDHDERRKEECHAGLANFLLKRKLECSPLKANTITDAKGKSSNGATTSSSPKKRKIPKTSWGWQSKSRAIEEVMSSISCRQSRLLGTKDTETVTSGSSEDEWDTVEDSDAALRLLNRTMASKIGSNSPEDEDANENAWEPSHPEALLERSEKPMAAAGQRSTAQYADMKTMFSLMGIPFLDAPGEAEQQCVRLVKDGLCQMAYTEDSDVLAMEAVPVVRHFFTAHPIFVDVCAMEQAGIVPGVARCVALLAGCDYRRGLPNFGVSTALKALLNFVPLIEREDKTDLDLLLGDRIRTWVLEMDAEDDPATVRAEGNLRKRVFEAVCKSGVSSFTPIAAYRNLMGDPTAKMVEWGPVQMNHLAAFLSGKLGQPIDTLKKEMLPVCRRWTRYIADGFPDFEPFSVKPKVPEKEDVRKLYEALKLVPSA